MSSPKGLDAQAAPSFAGPRGAATNAETIEERAAAEAREILAQFERLEAMGAFVGQSVSDHKQTFLTMSLLNFARREKLLHA